MYPSVFSVDEGGIFLFKHLLDFFEVFSEFIAIMMLSSLVNDKELYYSECETIPENLLNSLKMPNFGFWNNLCM